MGGYSRATVGTLRARLAEPVRNIQFVVGPRRVGKTQAVATVVGSDLLEAADNPTRHARHRSFFVAPGLVADTAWLEKVWSDARTNPRNRLPSGTRVLAIDEIQKIRGWANTVKGLWDHDRLSGLQMHVILLGSSLPLMQRAMNESLQGRFEVIHMRHWSFAEMQQAFDVTVDEYCFYGAYPGLVHLHNDTDRWRAAVVEQIIKPSIEQDVFELARVDRPQLFRRFFDVATQMSGQIVSLTNVLGELHQHSDGVGNTATLAKYLQFTSDAGLVTATYQYAPNVVRQRTSKPKFHVLNTALLTAQLRIRRDQLANNPLWGRIVESAIGAHILNSTSEKYGAQVNYWIPPRSQGEIDFVVSGFDELFAIEVKAGAGGATKWLKLFKQHYPRARCFIVCDCAEKRSVDEMVQIPIQQALLQPLEQW